MQITPISPRRLRVSLEEEELSQLGLQGETLDPEDPKLRAFLLSLMKAACLTADFTLESQVFVEVYTGEEGGCTIYLNDLTDRPPRRWKLLRNQRLPVIYRFADVDALIEASVRLFRRCSHRVRESTLYRTGKDFALLLYPLDEEETFTLRFLDEYAERCGAGPLAAAWLGEHAEPLIEREALGLIAAYFG